MKSSRRVLSKLDADDLLKRIEQPRRKRQRLSEEAVSDASSSETSDKDRHGHFTFPDESSVEGSEGDEQRYGVVPVDEDGLEAETFQVLPSENDESRINLSSRARRPHSTVNSKDASTKSYETFSDLGVSKSLVATLSKMSIREPTEVQRACIPPLIAGRDCVGNAKTGSGKTIAFALPILQKLSIDPYGIYALVLTPTRELAFQISEQFAVLGAPLNIRTSVIVGGMDMIAQAIELNNRPHIIIATPGRIVDHLKSSSGEWDLSRIKFLVLDEADRLLTPTFAPELAHLFEVLPKERQTCLFTATMTDSIEALTSTPPRPGKQIPFVHRMSAAVETVDTLEQFYLLVPSHVREPYLFYLLCNPPDSIAKMRVAPPEPSKPKRNKKKSVGKSNKSVDDDPEAIEQPPPTIIFCARTRTAAFVSALLKTLGIRSTSLHSRLTQRERLNSLGLFRARVVPVLVTTDVGARGLDIDDVALVVNWDMPQEPEEYTHRVGRTARRGRSGLAVSFVTERDEERVLRIEERIKTKLVEMMLPEEKVLEKLNAVATAKRLANMELHDSDFGKREEIYKLKNEKRKRREQRLLTSSCYPCAAQHKRKKNHSQGLHQKPLVMGREGSKMKRNGAAHRILYNPDRDHLE